TEVFFNGRDTGDGRVLIYGVLARHLDGKPHNAILVIPDCEGELDMELLTFYARLGYDVLMFDYAGEREGMENRTSYPSAVKYANYIYSENCFNTVSESARETCWYEWCCVARYAVNFLVTRLGSKKIGVLGIKTGAEIMWHLVSCDERVTCAVALFGAGWRAYKNVRKYAPPAGEVKLSDERIRFIAGIDAHSFAPYCRCPVALFTSTNSAEYDADRAHDTLRRVNSDVDAFFCLSPRMGEAVDLNCVRNIELFFGIYLNGQRVQMASEPELKIKVEGESIELEVDTNAALKPRNVDIYVCEGETEPARRNWVKLDGVVKKGDSVFSAEYSLINGGGILFAFAVVDYRNGITVSTPITSGKCPETAVIKTNLIYSNTQGAGDFTYGVTDRSLLAGAMYCRRSPIELVRGPMGITGISSSKGLLTYKVSERCVDIRPDSIFKLDLYCDTEITLAVRLRADIGTPFETVYNNYTSVPRGEVWQNVVLSIKDFKTDDGMPLSEDAVIGSINFSADGFFAINNVLLI
ncbi:MAG: hypothetical protein J6Z34_00165, partial [Clostridia bacterium]|nr:hypothetical protein [Clostridia bacterium]